MLQEQATKLQCWKRSVLEVIRDAVLVIPIEASNKPFEGQTIGISMQAAYLIQ